MILQGKNALKKGILLFLMKEAPILGLVQYGINNRRTAMKKTNF